MSNQPSRKMPHPGKPSESPIPTKEEVSTEAPVKYGDEVHKNLDKQIVSRATASPRDSDVLKLTDELEELNHKLDSTQRGVTAKKAELSELENHLENLKMEKNNLNKKIDAYLSPSK